MLLRGDMDALPVAEETGPRRSPPPTARCTPAATTCTPRAWSARARLLARTATGCAGDVVLMFQPGEEGWDGAGVMLREGVLDAAGRRVDAAYGTHVFSNTWPACQVLSRPGPLMAASHGLFVTVRGAGRPRLDTAPRPRPDRGAAEMMTALQTMVTRRFDVFDPVVVTVGVVEGGTQRNIIPDTARFEATVRRFSEASAATLRDGIRETLQGVAQAHGVEVDVEYGDEYPLTVNDAGEVEFAAGVVREVLGEERYAELPFPITGSEDFSRVLAAVPGAFVFIGATLPDRDPETAPSNHSPRADFDPGVLPDAAALYAELAVRKLEHLAG